jgi:hypothetical protein
MDTEVNHIEADKLKVFEEKDLLWQDSQIEAHANCTAILSSWCRTCAGRSTGIIVSLADSLDFTRSLSHTPPEYKDVWRPLPWILRKVLVPYVFAMKYSGCVLVDL